MKILNLFSGIGGNRELWKNEYEITAVEYDEKIAKLYSERFPKDKMIIGDAYEYLEKNYQEFDIIWASPPCVTHSRININFNQTWNIRLPDLKLYSIIIFLKQWFKGNWIVENVIPFYSPLIKPSCIRGRHCYWSNVAIPSDKKKRIREVGCHHSKKYLSTLNPKQQTKEKFSKIVRNKVNSMEGKILLDYLIHKNQKSIFDYNINDNTKTLNTNKDIY